MDKGKEILEWIRKCPVFLLLVVSGLLFTAVGAAGRFSLYGDMSGTRGTGRFWH